MLNWDETGFYKGFIPNKANTKQPSGAYKNTNENYVTLETAKGHNSYSGILEKESVLMECDDQQNSELLMKIIQGEQLKFLVTDRNGGQGIENCQKNETN